MSIFFQEQKWLKPKLHHPQLPQYECQLVKLGACCSLQAAEQVGGAFFQPVQLVRECLSSSPDCLNMLGEGGA